MARIRRWFGALHHTGINVDNPRSGVVALFDRTPAEHIRQREALTALPFE